MSDLVCRVATLRDSAALMRMMTAFNTNEGIAYDSATAPLDLLLGDANLGLVLLFELVGQPAGYAVVTWNYDLEYGGRDAFLTELWIEPAHRGKGHGRSALAHIENACREHEAAALHLAVRPDNTGAVKLYESAGYADWPRRVLSKTLR
ncbi:MAG: GNAT family N-acetyltransferase [Planctomycetes bacterium]|nr:GNAT family N-acetyltransferase [Planctomycetota bacterium]